MNKEFINLPPLAYGELMDGEIILVKKGEEGFFRIENPQNKTAKELNEEIGVSERDATILKAQSMREE